MVEQQASVITQSLAQVVSLGQAEVLVVPERGPMILTDAADEGLIPTNPIRRYRLEREQVWATPTEVLRIAEQAAALGGETAAC